MLLRLETSAGIEISLGSIQNRGTIRITLLYIWEIYSEIDDTLFLYTYTHGHKSRTDSPFMEWNGIFQKGVEEGKIAVTPLSFKIQITTDKAFKMREVMSLNSQWFQKYVVKFETT